MLRSHSFKFSESKSGNVAARFPGKQCFVAEFYGMPVAKTLKYVANPTQDIREIRLMMEESAPKTNAENARLLLFTPNGDLIPDDYTASDLPKSSDGIARVVAYLSRQPCRAWRHVLVRVELVGRDIQPSEGVGRVTWVSMRTTIPDAKGNMMATRVGDFMQYVRKNLVSGVNSEQALFLAFDKESPVHTSHMTDIYAKHGKTDGFVRANVSLDSVFG